MPVKGPQNVSLKVALKHLTAALLNPEAENVCAVTMGFAALRIEQEIERHTTPSGKAKFVNSHPDLLRAGMHFLTASPGMLRAKELKFRLCCCRCDWRQADDTLIALHSIEHWLRDWPRGVEMDEFRFQSLMLHAALGIISNCLVLSISRLTQHKFRGTLGCEGGSRGSRWPQGPQDLFPNGLERSFQGLEGWAIDPHGLLAHGHWEGFVPVEYSVYQLIGQLVAYHEPFAASLLDLTKIPITIIGPTGYLEVAGLLHKEGNFRAFERVLGMILDFYDTVEEYDFVQFEELMGTQIVSVLLQNWWVSLNEVVSTRPEWKKMHRRIYRLAMNATLVLHDVIGEDRPTFPIEGIPQPKLTEVDRLEDAFRAMVRTRKAGCLNPRCPPSAGVAHTRQCSNCKVVLYCDEKCQKQAWKTSKYPHKDLCAKLYGLKGAIGDGDWETIWRPGFTFAMFQAMIESNDLAAQLVKSIGIAISGVHLQKFEGRKAYVEARRNSPAYAMEQEASVARSHEMAKSTGLYEALDKGPISLKLLTPVL